MHRIGRVLILALAFGLISSLPGRVLGQSFELDATHSFIAFEIRHGDLTNAWGLAVAPSGTIVLDSADPTKSSFNISVKADSIITGNPQRDNHLRGSDFFDARQFPTISFKSTAVKMNGQDYEVTGDFNLHGVTKPLTVTIKKTGERQGNRPGIGMGTKFTIKRSDYGMTGMQNMLGDEVTIHVNMEGNRR